MRPKLHTLAYVRHARTLVVWSKHEKLSDSHLGDKGTADCARPSSAKSTTHDSEALWTWAALVVTTCKPPYLPSSQSMGEDKGENKSEEPCHAVPCVPVLAATDRAEVRARYRRHLCSNTMRCAVASGHMKSMSKCNRTKSNRRRLLLLVHEKSRDNKVSRHDTRGGINHFTKHPATGAAGLYHRRLPRGIALAPLLPPPPPPPWPERDVSHELRAADGRGVRGKVEGTYHGSRRRRDRHSHGRRTGRHRRHHRSASSPAAWGQSAAWPPGER